MKEVSLSWVIIAALAGLGLVVSAFHGAKAHVVLASAAECAAPREPAVSAPSSKAGEPSAEAEISPLLAEQPLSALEAALLAAPDGDAPEFARRIAERNADDAVRSLVRVAQAARSATAEAALSALGSIDAESARVYFLAELAANRDRVHARAAIGYFKDAVDARAVPALERLGQSQGSELSTDIVEALVLQGAEAHASLSRLAASPSSAGKQVFSAARPVPLLRPALRAACARRWRAGSPMTECFDFLASETSAEGRAILVAAAHDPAFIDDAVVALSSRGDPSSRAALLDLQRSSVAAERCEATHALLLQPEARSLPTLSALVDGSMRSDATHALLDIGAPLGTRMLSALLYERNARVRADAVSMLATYGPRDSERQLRAMLRDDSYGVRLEAMRALRKLDVDVRVDDIN